MNLGQSAERQKREYRMTGRLLEKAAIITGGAGGIGSATAQLFCEQGAAVLVVDREKDSVETAVAQIRSQVPHSNVLGIALDLALEESAARAIEIAKRSFGRLDIVVNNAGIRAYEPLAEARSVTWHQILAVNLLAYAYLAREALPEMRKRPGASIVNISSTHAFNARAGMGQYDVTKAGIVSLTKTLAAEEACHGIRVNAVCPGPILTPFHVRRAEAAGGTASDLETEKRRDCLLERWAKPREVAFPILWLASDEASYVTGSVIMADGGMPVI
jgi:2-hydroxycyclohexanecarboxyl-CoA dehydrogenase